MRLPGETKPMPSPQTQETGAAKTGHDSEVARRERFEFGENWARFLRVLDEERIRVAEESLRIMLKLPDLAGKRFLDIGSGSGLFSLAARRLGATVHSFDYDPRSVACTRELQRRYFPADERWTIEEGSAVDDEYMAKLGVHDIVYSWGVLHHTGAMWRGLDLARQRVAEHGFLFISLYNDMGPESDRWRKLKRLYVRLPPVLRPPYAVITMLPYEVKLVARALLDGRPQDYLHHWTRYREKRGMSRWRDIIDWVGGYPYEVATADEVIDYFEARGFSPRTVWRDNGLGCNQFVFERMAGRERERVASP